MTGGSSRVAERVSRSPLFDADEYLRLYPAVAAAGRDPIEHYVTDGMRGRMRGRSEQGVARLLGRIEADFTNDARAYRRSFQDAQAEAAEPRAGGTPFVGIYCHTQAHYYMHSIAAAIDHAILRAGGRCALLTEVEADPSKIDVPLIVAPHEFFNMPLPDAYREPAFVDRCVMFNTEQLPSDWILEALPWLYRARAVIDLHFQSSLVWRRGGIPSTHVLPPFDAELAGRAIGEFDRRHPLVRWMDPAWLDMAGAQIRVADRPIDVFFSGHATPARSECFARNAAFLSRKRAVLAYARLSPVGTPRDEHTRSLFGINIALARLAKTVLGLHRHAIGYFVWERMVVQGFGCGTPVLTGPCLRSPFFEATQHYLEAVGGHFDEMLEHLVDTADGLALGQAVADQARVVLERELTAARCGRFLLSFLAGLEAPDA